MTRSERPTLKPAASNRTRVLYPVDWIVLGYCLLMTAILVLLGRPVSQYVDEIIFYLGMGCLTALIVYYLDESAGGWRAFLRVIYPAIMFTFFYRTTEGQMFLLFDRFFDAQVVSLEQTLLGDSPTLYIDRQLLEVWVTELLSFCYFCYYLIVPGFLFPAFVRKDYRIIRQYLAAASLTFFVSYLLFWLYPVEGPRWFLANQYTNTINGPVFRPLVEFVIDKAAIHGGAMPSSHTGVALVTMLFCFRYYRQAGWILLPIVTGLALGTIWGRFHYASDVILGAVIGILAVWFVWKYLDRSAREGPVDETLKEMRTQDVS